ncbi:putative uncharacterized protein DDB_G0281733 [Drosophila nasuta]|uniref:putative uncharacterized protein DDB_G0281733 n=1 Tax=Drosophila nasuta TaxID=42062 RepID=UPI00295F12B0|nr:putative uncharacterized protein DDB_G0281733 [Drosophila nasuta]
MVAFYDDEYEGIEQPKTLTYWVRNFRMKRVQMRRKMRGSGSLRVNAILSTALFNAEHELRRKQQERFSRWLDIQTKFVPHGKTHCASDANEKYEAAAAETERAEFERRNIENNLWSSELSGLDSFLSSLSSSNNNNNDSSNNKTNNNGSSNNFITNNNNQHHCAIAVQS